MTSNALTSAVYTAVAKILKPLVRILLRNGVSYTAFSEIAKRIYFEIALNEFVIPGKKQTNTRISTITGFTRKEVLRQQKLPVLSTQYSSERYNRAARVISAWGEDPEFLDKRGKPASLPFEGKRKSFMSLVKKSSGDITARTILDELLHNEIVTVMKDGRIRLLTQAYIPKGDDLEKIDILGTDVADQINTINHNLICAADQQWFQRKVSYDNIPIELLEALHKKATKKAQAALISINHDLAKGDRDQNPKVKGTGQYRIGIGIYYFQNKIKPKGGKP